MNEIISGIKNTKVDSDITHNLDCNPPSSKSIFTDPEMLEGTMTKTMTIILMIIAVLTISINLGVVIRVYKLIKRGGDLKPAFYLIGNLAVSDFLIGLYIVIIFCIDLTQLSTKWRDKCCGLLTAFVVTACEETICSITLIAIDKYIFICHGIAYRTIVRKSRVRIAIILTWIFSLIIGFLPAIGLHESDWCACNFTLYISKQFAIVLFVTSVVFPLTIIVSLYSIILTLAIKVTKNKIERSKSKGATLFFRVSLKAKSSKSSSSNTMSTKLSSSYASSSSNASSNKSKKNRNLKDIPDIETETKQIEELKGLPSIVSVKATKSNNSELPTVVELHEVDLMPYELDSSSDENDSEDKIEEKNKTTGSPKPNTGFYDFDNPIEKVGNGESQVHSVYLQSYKQNVDEDELSKDAEKDSLNSIDEIKEEDETDTENCSLTANNENSNKEKGSRLQRKRSYFKKILSESKDKVLFLQKCRAIKPIILILFCFLVTYVPFVTCNLAFKLQDEKSEHLFKALNNLLYLAVVINSLINPFVYAYGYKEFRIKTKNFKGICAKDQRRRNNNR